MAKKFWEYQPTLPGGGGRLSRSLGTTTKVGLIGTALSMMGTLPVLAENQALNPFTLNVQPQVLNTVSFAPPLGTAADYLPEIETVESIYLVLNLAERMLYLYDQEHLVATYPVAIGRQGWETPTGRFSIFQMQEDPTWQHPFTGELFPPGGNNPLGRRWLGFWSDGTNFIGFHGTPNEASIGQAISHGCVRLRNQDVIELYEQVALGTTVYVVP